MYVVYRQIGIAAHAIPEPRAVEPGDSLPGSRRWLPDPHTGLLRPELRDSLTSGFGYVDAAGEYHEEHRVSLRRRYWALRHRARTAYRDHRVFMVTISHVSHDASEARAWVSRAVQPLRAAGVHYVAVVERHTITDDLHVHVLVHVQRGGMDRTVIREHFASMLPQAASTVRVDEATSRASAERLAAYVGKSLLSNPDDALMLNTPACAKKNAAYLHSRGFWGRGGWRAVYRANLVAYRERIADREAADTAREVEAREDRQMLSLRAVSALRSRTAFTITLSSSFSLMGKITWSAVRASENDASAPQIRRTHPQNARAPPRFARVFPAAPPSAPP